MVGMIDCTLSQLVLGMVCFVVALCGLGGFIGSRDWGVIPYLLVFVGCMMLCVSLWRIRTWMRPGLVILAVALVLLLLLRFSDRLTPVPDLFIFGAQIDPLPASHSNTDLGTFAQVGG